MVNAPIVVLTAVNIPGSSTAAAMMTEPNSAMHLREPFVLISDTVCTVILGFQSLATGKQRGGSDRVPLSSVRVRTTPTDLARMG